MGNRNLETSHNYGKGLVNIAFSFLTNGAANPLLSTLRGVDASIVQSITYVATGKYTIQLSPKDNYRYVVDKFADLEDIASPDGGYASIGAAANEGSSTLGIAVVVATFTTGGALTAFTGRRVSVNMDLKNSTVGS